MRAKTSKLGSMKINLIKVRKMVPSHLVAQRVFKNRKAYSRKWKAE